MKRATSSSVSLVRIGTDSKLLPSAARRAKRLRSRGVTSITLAISLIVASRSATLDGVISSV
jgi:hypothetical protein